ncbi:hypothetical protein [Xanthomonas sacchari]|uniref:hypothetical protein n=1 Tax=Xanthomonas sacchari TaxID=56458 RepID=UPI00224DE9E3|nr:hypothetical protein [Xanthomonas sacchari]
MIDEFLSDEPLADIRIHLQQQQAFGTNALCGMVEAKTPPLRGCQAGEWPRKPNEAIPDPIIPLLDLEFPCDEITAITIFL